MSYWVSLVDSFRSSIIDPADVIRAQLEEKLARHPEVYARMLQQAISEAPEPVAEVKKVEEVKEAPKVEVN